MAWPRLRQTIRRSRFESQLSQISQILQSPPLAFSFSVDFSYVRVSSLSKYFFTTPLIVRFLYNRQKSLFPCSLLPAVSQILQILQISQFCYFSLAVRCFFATSRGFIRKARWCKIKDLTITCLMAWWYDSCHVLLGFFYLWYINLVPFSLIITKLSPLERWEI